MEGRIACSSFYHTRLPHQWELERMGGLTRQARARLRWMDNYRRHGNARKTCRHFDISPTTFYKWLARYRERGPAGLEDRSRAPRRKRASTIPWQTVEEVVGLRRRYPAWSRHKLAVVLARDHGISLSASSIGRILARKGLYDQVPARRRRRRRYARTRKKLRAQAFLRDMWPGCLVQIDTKHLRFQQKKFYQFTAVDCFSRLGFARVFSSASSRMAGLFLEELAAAFPFEIAAVQTDNGSEFEGDFHAALEARGIAHYFTCANCPQSNGRAERLIGSTQQELWDFRDAYTVADADRLAQRWFNTYNYVRPHQGLGYLTPIEKLAAWYDGEDLKAGVSTM